MKTIINYFAFTVLIFFYISSLNLLSSARPLDQYVYLLKCADTSIELNETHGQCECHDKSICKFTQHNIISGCPCNDPQDGELLHINKCLRMAQKNDCNMETIYCKGDQGSCRCKDGRGSAIWSKTTTMHGPCGQSTQGMKIVGIKHEL